MKKNIFTLLDENGKEIVYEVLFTYKSDQTNKNYIVYTDNTKDQKGNTVVYASIYHPEDENGGIEPIETEAEWKLIETILLSMQKEIQNTMKPQKDDL